MHLLVKLSNKYDINNYTDYPATRLSLVMGHFAALPLVSTRWVMYFASVQRPCSLEYMLSNTKITFSMENPTIVDRTKAGFTSSHQS